MKRFSIFLLIFFKCGLLYAQGIPLNYSLAPATDLIYQGQPVSSTEAFALSQQSVDLSLLDPTEGQDIWKNVIRKPEAYKVEKFQFTEVNFKSFVLSQSGKLRFLGKTAQGDTLNFVTSKNVHTQIMRRNLLIKIGYEIPYLAWVPKIKIKFANGIDRELFVKELAEKTLGEPKRWIEEEGENFVVMNDLIVQKTGNEIIDLSNGYLPSGIIRGRRVLNSLHALYALTDLGESVNLFSWSPGHIFNEHIFLPYEFQSEFSATLDDVRWMTRRLAALSREDWESIIDSSYLPAPVSALITEKILARRNQLIKLVKLPINDIPYEPQISFGEEVSDGELIQDKFPGYAARFSFGDPESPMNIKELLYFGGIKGISLMIDTLTSKFNSLPFLSNTQQLNSALEERATQNFINEINEYLKTGVYKSTPLGMFALPMVSGSLIASRDVVAGNYLGTDNLFQLVDSLGVSASAGMYLGVEGTESMGLTFPVAAEGSASVSLNRVYSHVKPIRSMKGAFKYPFVNLLVPLSKIRVGRKLTPLLAVQDEDLTQDETKEMIKEVITTFNSKMSPGESFIVTDSIGASLAATAGASFLQILTAKIGVSGNQLIISRLHILKMSDEEYHIYRDFGNITQFQAQFGLSAILPILKVKFAMDKGKARVNFYKMNVSKTASTREEIDQYLILKNLFTKGSLASLKNSVKPVKLRYKLDQKIIGGGFLVGQYARINSRFNLKVQHPEGEEIELYRRYSAQSTGLNYLALGTDVTQTIVNLFLDPNFKMASYDGGGNAGFTFMGKAFSKTSTFESSSNYLNEENYTPVVKLSRIWNGWSIKQNKALKILNKIRARYEYDFYPPDVLNETRKIFLYSFHVNFIFYHHALRHVASLTEQQLYDLGHEYSRPRVKFLGVKLKWLKYHHNKILSSTSLKDISYHQNKFFDMAEQIFTLEGIEKLCGGKQNFFVYSRIEGFRAQDENGDQPLFSNSYGEYGHNQVTGPFDYLKRLLGISESELGLNWILRRIY